MVKLIFRKNFNLCDHNPPTDRLHAIARARFVLKCIARKKLCGGIQSLLLCDGQIFVNTYHARLVVYCVTKHRTSHTGIKYRSCLYIKIDIIDMLKNEEQVHLKVVHRIGLITM